ncbi:MAG: histidinol dehydrogenase, partial [Acidimicrobiia bacterium]
MLERLDLRGNVGDLASVLAPPHRSEPDPGAVEAVRGILSDVRRRGDAALFELTARFDGAELDALAVPKDELVAALDATPAPVRAAMEFARDQISAYHATQIEDDRLHIRGGVTVRSLTRPVDRAGCYVPGGRAAYPSTVLMTVIPAQLAGVGGIALCVPPAADGQVSRATLAAAALLELDEVYRVGGAQAIAALAYGTETIRAVDVIVGPGNVYVTLAKREVAGTVGIESLAGPSELVVVADDSAEADWVAIDLMAQAEHGPGGAALLVTWSEQLAAAVDAALARLLEESSRRSHIEATIASGGRCLLVDGPTQAIAAANVVAPEHLQLMTADPWALVPLVRHAGAVFCGHYAPAPVGDYVAGVNHVLPTART